MECQALGKNKRVSWSLKKYFNLIAMASNLITCNGLQPTSAGHCLSLKHKRSVRWTCHMSAVDVRGHFRVLALRDLAVAPWGSCFLVLGRAFARRKTQSRCKGGGKEAESVPEERQSTQSTVVNDMVEVPQDVGFPLPGVFEGLPPPSLANGWTLLGDLAACIFAAPFLAILSRLAGALKPEWFMHSENNGNAFIFPEASHGVMFWLCWCIGRTCDESI